MPHYSFRLVQHPCCCKFYGASTAKDNPFLVLEFYARGSLKDITDKKSIEKSIKKEQIEANKKGKVWENHRFEFL